MSDVQTPEPAETIHPDQPVSIDIGGIEVTGVGETEASLREGLRQAEAKIEKPSKGRQRYSELTSERDHERQLRESVERERDELKSRLEAASRTPAPTVSERAPASAPAAPAPLAEKFTFPTYTDWLTAHPAAAESADPYEDWRDAKDEARNDWKLSRIDFDARVRSSIEADRAQQSFGQRVTETFTKGRAAYPDFDAILSSGPGLHVNLGPTPAQANARLLAVVHAPNSEHLQYAIGKDAALAHRLSRMTDVEFGMAIAALAPAAPAASPASTGTVGSFMPPPPMQPVGSGSKTAVASAYDLAERAGEDYDSSGFREQLRRERGTRR